MVRTVNHYCLFKLLKVIASICTMSCMPLRINRRNGNFTSHVVDIAQTVAYSVTQQCDTKLFTLSLGHQAKCLDESGASLTVEVNGIC